MLVVRDALALAHELTLGGDDRRAVELGDDVDDAGAADTDGLLSVRADDAERGLHGIAVDLDGFDRAVGRAHAAGDVAALKGGTGRAGAGHHKVAVAEDQLAVGAEVDEERELILVPDEARERARGDIAADIRADVRGKQDLGVGVRGEAEVLGGHAAPLEKRRDIGFHAHGVRVDAEEQMVHRGVGGDADAENARDGDARRFAHRRDQRQKRLFEDRVLQALDAAGLRLLDDAVDDVRAVADLTVAGRGLGRERAGGKVHENAGDGRRADIDGAAVERRVGFFRNVHHGQHAVCQRAGDEDLEIRVPQRLGELFDGMVGEPDLRAAVECGLREARKALGVGHGVVERRLVQLDQGLHKVVREVDAGSLHILLQLVEDRDLLAGGEVSRLHPALVGGGDVGDENGDVARGLRRAAEPPAGGVIRIGDVAGLHAGHVAGDELHAAFAARAVAVAGRVDGDVGRLGSLENGAAGRGGEMDLLRAVFELEGDFVHAVMSFPEQKCVETAAGGIRGTYFRRPLRGTITL